MLSKISKNGVGLVVLIVTLFNLDIPEALIEEAVAGLGAMISLGLMIYNQMSRADLKYGLFRK